jgi:hypothetical protein
MDLFMLKIKLFFLLCLFTITGCETVHYTYKAPATDSGRMCVTQCSAIKESCMTNQIQLSNKQSEACERNSDLHFMSCLSTAKTDKEKQKCEDKQSYCGSYVNDEPCEQKYRECFTNCGGTINQYIE